MNIERKGKRESLVIYRDEFIKLLLNLVTLIAVVVFSYQSSSTCSKYSIKVIG